MKCVKPPVTDRLRKYESIVYAALWLFILLLPFLNELLRVFNDLSFCWCRIIRWWVGLIPFIIVFVVNNYILVPRCLLKNRFKQYIPLVGILILAFLAFQSITYEFRMDTLAQLQEQMGESRSGNARGSYRFLGLPMPLVTNLSLALLLIAINTSVIALFKYLREREKLEALEMIRLKDELKFLKAQINPHFFMNMLNNIHAMIELDPLKAQDMTLELSKLMRYVLYEGENATVSFADEVAFVSSYIALMRRRYPEDKVDIRLDIPDTPSKDIILSPMLFVTFIENAFKHGISYQNRSVVYVSFEEKDGKVRFFCRNSVPSGLVQSAAGGVGLDNVQRRLSLLYGSNFELRIDDGKEFYEVELLIPSL